MLLAPLIKDKHQKHQKVKTGLYESIESSKPARVDPYWTELSKRSYSFTLGLFVNIYLSVKWGLDIQSLSHVRDSSGVQAAVTNIFCSSVCSQWICVQLPSPPPLHSVPCTLGSLLSGSALGQEVGPALGNNSWMNR